MFPSLVTEVIIQGQGRRQGVCLGRAKCLATAARAQKFCASPEKVAQRGGGGGTSKKNPTNHHTGLGVLSSWPWLTAEPTSQKKIYIYGGGGAFTPPPPPVAPPLFRGIKYFLTPWRFSSRKEADYILPYCDLITPIRSETLKNQAGQVAFPGGKKDEEDPDLMETALREASEEIGLPPHQVLHRHGLSLLRELFLRGPSETTWYCDAV